jgi:single-strand DNA-binding protein
MFQQLIVAGNLGRDPEMRYTPDGKAVTSLSVAVNAGKDKTLWVNVATFDKLAESCSQYLHKGDQVMVSGELSEPYAYVGKEDGQPHARLEMVARVVRFGKRAEGSANLQNLTGQAAPEAEQIPF